jgi:hypothetical protein
MSTLPATVKNWRAPHVRVLARLTQVYLFIFVISRINTSNKPLPH